MTIPAICRAGSAQLMAHAVNARGVIFPLFLMTTRAIRRRQLAFVNQILDSLMAINAIQLRVNGFDEGVRRKQQRYGFASNLPGRRRIEMTIQAIGVLEFFGGSDAARAGEKTQQCEDQRHLGERPTS